MPASVDLTGTSCQYSSCDFFGTLSVAPQDEHRTFIPIFSSETFSLRPQLQEKRIDISSPCAAGSLARHSAVQFVTGIPLDMLPRLLNVDRLMFWLMGRQLPSQRAT